MTGMDEDNDGIACEHLSSQLVFYETLWFRILIGAIVVLGVVGLWWSRKVKAANATRNEPVLFPGRSSTEEVEDQLALLKADKAIDEVEETPQNQRQ